MNNFKKNLVKRRSDKYLYKILAVFIGLMMILTGFLFWGLLVVASPLIFKFSFKTKIGSSIINFFRERPNLTPEERKKEEDRQEKIAAAFGKIFRPIFIIGLGLFLYNLTPGMSYIFDYPLGQITLRDISWLILDIGIICVFARWLLNPITHFIDEGSYAIWGYFAYVFIGILSILIILSSL